MRANHVSSAARRYARALFELAQESGRMDAIAAQVAALGELASDAEFRALLPDPRIEAGPKARAVRGALGGGADALVIGLLEALERRGRLELLLQIPVAFQEYADEAAGRLRGVLESPQMIAETEVQAIEQVLSQRTGKAVTLHCEVLPELLGGVRVTLAGTRYDGSVRGRLDQVSQRLAAAEIG